MQQSHTCHSSSISAAPVQFVLVTGNGEHTVALNMFDCLTVHQDNNAPPPLSICNALEHTIYPCVCNIFLSNLSHRHCNGTII